MSATRQWTTAVYQQVDGSSGHAARRMSVNRCSSLGIFRVQGLLAGIPHPLFKPKNLIWQGKTKSPKGPKR